MARITKFKRHSPSIGAVGFILAALVLSYVKPVRSYVAGVLKPHNHSSVTDGGILSNLSVNSLIIPGGQSFTRNTSADPADSGLTIKISTIGFMSFYNAGSYGITQPSNPNTPGTPNSLFILGDVTLGDVQTLTGPNVNTPQNWNLGVRNPGFTGPSKCTVIHTNAADASDAVASSSSTAGGASISLCSDDTNNGNSATSGSLFFNAYSAGTGTNANLLTQRIRTANGTETSVLTENSQGVTFGDGVGTLKPSLNVYAKSIDGATQGVNCIGVITANGTNQLTWTSTTTASAPGLLGVLTNSCPSGAFCQVQIMGQATVTETGAATLGDCIVTSGTRCQASQSGAISLTCSGVILQTTGGAGNVQAWMGWGGG